MSERDELIRAALSRLLEIEAEIKALKQIYAERDELTKLLCELEFSSLTYEGHIFALCDNFAEKNVAYRMAFIPRFEIKIKGET